MNVFPQLATGAVGQFPFRASIEYRTILAVQADGSETRLADPDAEQRSWDLSLDGLSAAEWNDVEALFTTVNGRYGTFLFLEPGANLLSWSDQLQNGVWQAHGGAAVVGGTSDPLGGSLGFTVSGGAGAALRQALAVPTSFRYCGSVWARTSGGGAALRVSDGAGVGFETSIIPGGGWKRYSVQFPGGGTGPAIEFELQAGAAQLEVYGPQLEAQSAPSTYKGTQAQGGVYPNARFDNDVLTDRATGLGLHSGALRIVWTPSLT